MPPTFPAELLDGLAHGPAHSFGIWPNPDLPVVGAGVYTVWDGDRFLYVGMGGRGLSADMIRDATVTGRKGSGLLGRLMSHASGRRSGDQFCIYVCDLLILPTLTPEQ